MKYVYLLVFFVTSSVAIVAQTSITAVSTANSTAPSSFSYTSGANTYNWGTAPNNNRVFVNGFTSGGQDYTYASFLTGNIKIRRVNNAVTTGNFALVWAEAVTAGSVFNMFPEYQNDMELFFNGRVYNKGTDNFFDNVSANSNNVERMDWIMPGGYASGTPALVGFAVFERGAVAAHDPFCIAAITALDGSGNPSAYSNIVRVVGANYGDPGPNVTYRILKAQNPANLIDAGTGTQSRGGLIVSFQNLGIAVNQRVYGYSLFANDLPGGATPADLVNFNNATFFPTNTAAAGGVDLVAVTGVYIANSVLPARFLQFSAVENNQKVQLVWQTDNELSVNKYIVERSLNAIDFFPLGSVSSIGNSSAVQNYKFDDTQMPGLTASLYYRIKQIDNDGTYHYSNTITIRSRNHTGKLQINPNPVQTSASVRVYSAVNANAAISIFTAQGMAVFNKTQQLFTGNNSFMIELPSQLAPGYYQMKVVLENQQTLLQSFIKQ